MKFSKNIIRSFIDLPDKTSMMVFSIGCNLNCYKCFNHDLLTENPKKIVDERYILNQIQLNGFLFDAIIFSGGEFLNNDINETINFLKNVRAIYDGIIIINTNGTYPDKMKILNDLELVDGFHTDMKIPIHMIDIHRDKDIINKVVGKSLTQNEISNMIESIHNTIMFDKGYSQIRSVKYPMFDERVFTKNKEYINQINQKYNKNTPYFINDFVDMNSDIDQNNEDDIDKNYDKENKKKGKTWKKHKNNDDDILYT